MIWVYRILFIPLSLLASPYYLFRMWRRGGYRERVSNRFGLNFRVNPKKSEVKRIWIQAVSVGELLAIEPLLAKLNKRKNIEIVLTTTTSTGLRIAKTKYTELTHSIGVFPIDFYLFSKKAWSTIAPDLVVLMESELWPEHLAQAKVRKVPVALINARLSDRSFNRQLKLKLFTESLFAPVTQILTSSPTDQMRFSALSWAKDKVAFSGNLKFDLTPSLLDNSDTKETYLHEFGFGKKDSKSSEIVILLGASTWPGEEKALIDSYLSLKKEFPHLRLLLVPRHAERKPQLLSLVSEYRIPFHFRTNQKQAPLETEVYIADTTGELRTFTQIADIVFVGKSLPPHDQGQSPIEAAVFAKPILFGPIMSNFRSIATGLVEDGVAKRVSSLESLTNAIHHLLDHPEVRTEMQEAAKASFKKHRGATEKTVQALENLLFN